MSLPIALVLLRIVGLLTGDVALATKQLVRSLPLLLIPFIFLLQAPSTLVRIERYMFFGILLALLTVSVVCNYHVFVSIIANNESITHIFRWKYLNFNFIDPFDIHPPYIALFVIFCIIQTLYSNFVPKKTKLVIVVGLLFFLFQLMARNAIFIGIVLFLWYVITHKNNWFKWSVLLVLVVLGFVTYTSSTKYLKEKFFYVFTEDSTGFENNRFSRLAASLEVFKVNPIIGVGPGDDDIYRKKAFLKMGDTVAYDNNYNSHNQYFEYAATYGLLGVLLFAGVLMVLLKWSKNHENQKYNYLLIAFMLACITESLLERAQGIKYFGLLLGLIFLSTITKNNAGTISHGSRP